MGKVFSWVSKPQTKYSHEDATKMTEIAHGLVALLNSLKKVGVSYGTS